MLCPACGQLLTDHDCFCDGVVCSACGVNVRKLQCDGKCRSCKDATREQERNIEWLRCQVRESIAQALAQSGCPWLPCRSADCAQWGTDPTSCARREAMLESLHGMPATT